MWLLHPGFVELIRNWWGELEVWGPPGQRFRLKLKGIRDMVRRWTREVFGNIKRKKNDLLGGDPEMGQEGKDRGSGGRREVGKEGI